VSNCWLFCLATRGVLPIFFRAGSIESPLFSMKFLHKIWLVFFQSASRRVPRLRNSFSKFDEIRLVVLPCCRAGHQERHASDLVHHGDETETRQLGWAGRRTTPRRGIPQQLSGRTSNRLSVRGDDHWQCGRERVDERVCCHRRVGRREVSGAGAGNGAAEATYEEAA
jgi:hypothetical protein